jgi:UDP-N-acetylmuramyl pentapeptide synthase
LSAGVQLLDNRRLTGPNLFWDQPGAVLDIAVNGQDLSSLIANWQEEVRLLMNAMGWPADAVCSRVYAGGASLVIGAPIDVLYTACELNEVALGRTIARLDGQELADWDESVKQLNAQKIEEQNPALLALQTAAADQQVPFLWDDDEVSVGFGKNSTTWPVDRLPSPEDVDWSKTGSIPLGIVTGTNGKSTTVRLAASILAAAELQAGITSTDYIRVGDEILDHGDYSGPGGARTLLRHPKSEAVVLEVARGGLLRRGIGVERADGALITNIAADHLGDYGINSVAEMAEAKFIIRRALGPSAPLILNCDDPESVRMAARLDNRIIWFGLDPCHPILAAHLEAGGQAAYLADGWLVWAEGNTARNIVRIAEVPVTFGGAARYNISNALGAMALCHVLGAEDLALAAGLKNFSGDAEVNPGRGNLFEKDGIRIFLDFAHNEHGINAIRETVNAFNARRNIVLMGQAGDRSDEDLDNLVKAVCKLDPQRLLVCELPGYERGRQTGAVPRLITGFARQAGVPDDAIAVFGSPLEGVTRALNEVRKGDCLVLLALTQRHEVLAKVREFVAEG